jgi:4-hydroxybenzoate polyprenyltransferase
MNDRYPDPITFSEAVALTTALGLVLLAVAAMLQPVFWGPAPSAAGLAATYRTSN